MSGRSKDQDFIDELVDWMQAPDTQTVQTNGHARDVVGALADDEVIALARQAANAAKFEALFDRGDTSHYGRDDSAADMALVALLAFYSDDPEQIDRIFRRSALMRAKWDSKRAGSTYGWGTIGKVLDPNRDRYRYRYSYSTGNGSTHDEAPGSGLVAVDFADMPEPGVRSYILEPLIAAGWPTIVFGGAGVSKTITALSLAQALVDPETERWISWAVATCPVVYLDLELNAQEQARRAYRIARGNGREKPPKGVRYLSTFGVPKRKRGNVMRRALDECQKTDVGVLFIDSLGLALRGDPGEPTDVIAWFEDELAELQGAGVTPIMVDHMRRLQQGEKYQSLGVFGTVYKENLARCMIQVELVRRDRNEHSIVTRLRPKKSNFDELAEPVDVKTVFTGAEIFLYETALEDEHRAWEETLSAQERVLAAVAALGEADADEITAACGTLAKSTVKKELSRLRKEKKIEDTDSNGAHGARRVRIVTVTDTYMGNGNGLPDDNDPKTVAELFANPPEWLPGQLAKYRENPEMHFGPLCSAVAAAVYEDGSVVGDEVAEEVRAEVERILQARPSVCYDDYGPG